MNRFAAFVGAISLASLSPACSAQADEQSFSIEMLERARKALPGADMALNADEPLVIQVRKNAVRDESVINLHRVWHYCQNVKAADCEALKVDFLGKIGIIPPAVQRDSLRIIVRDREYFEYVQGQPNPGDDRLGIGRPIGGGLYAMLASDSKDATSLVSDKGLRELGLGEQRAWDIALRQTKAKLPPLPTGAQLRKGAVAFQEQEYLGSLLLDLPAWEKISREAGPDLFVTVVSDSFVFVATMPPGERFEAFRKTVADDCAQQERCISPAIYRFTQGQWAVAP